MCNCAYSHVFVPLCGFVHAWQYSVRAHDETVKRKSSPRLRLSELQDFRTTLWCQMQWYITSERLSVGLRSGEFDGQAASSMSLLFRKCPLLLAPSDQASHTITASSFVFNNAIEFLWFTCDITGSLCLPRHDLAKIPIKQFYYFGHDTKFCIVRLS